MKPILVPSLNQNDLSCLLVEWVCKSGSPVQRGTALAVLETSKASTELLAEADGIFEPMASAAKEYEYGSTVGFIFDNEIEHKAYLEQLPPTKEPDVSSLVLSRAARELMQQLNLSEADLTQLGKTTIKRSDVQALVQSKRGSGKLRDLEVSALQQTVARTVVKANQIPTGVAILRVECSEALRRLKQHTAASNQLIGLPELLVQTTAGLAHRFPFFFGRFIQGEHFLHNPDPNVGVTLDLGKGLFVPVVKGARSKSLLEIATDLLSFRIKAMQNAFDLEDLAEGDISISLHTDRDVLLALPLIVPGQACIVSLNSPHSVLEFDANREIVERTYVNIGATYDHRVANGSDAIQFLQAIKASLEDSNLQ